MWWLIFLTLSSLVYCAASSRSNINSLTESHGQEVIEIAGPIKDLPPGLEEEPSAETDDEDKATTTTLQPATKKDFRKSIDTRRRSKDIDFNQDDEEGRVEKELAEIYKDSIDYKTDSVEVTKEPLKGAVANEPLKVAVAKEPLKVPITKEPLKVAVAVTISTTVEEKPILRAKNNFKFQPDLNNEKEVERFRTSIDEISCDKTVTKKLILDMQTKLPKPSSAIQFTFNLLLGLVSISFNLCH